MCHYELREVGGKLSVLIDFMKYGRKKKLGTIAFLDFCPLYIILSIFILSVLYLNSSHGST